MPWTSESFKEKHNHSLSPAQSAHAASVANAVLRRTGDEGMAIRVANAREMPHRAMGGMAPHIPGIGQHMGSLGITPARQPHTSIHLPSLMPRRDYGGPVGTAAPASTPGLQPTAANANPMLQGYIQRFSAMPPEQLQELVARLGNSPLAGIAQRVLQQKRLMPAAPTYAPTAQPTPLSDQSQQQPQQAFVQQPAQQPMPPIGMQPAQQAARGGKAGEDTVPILAAGGEFIIAPRHVARWGDGDIKEGHRRLDKFVVEERQRIIKEMSKLKPPVKS